MSAAKEPNLIRRIDRNQVFGSSDAVLELVMTDKNKSHFLYRVGGSAVGVVTGESKFGDWQKLVGRFKAINCRGEEFTSGTAFLPGDAVGTVANKLNNAEVENVSFLFDIFARYDSQLGTKYGYIVEPVRKVTEGDPIDLLFNDVAQIPMLEAPGKKK